MRAAPPRHTDCYLSLTPPAPPLTHAPLHLSLSPHGVARRADIFARALEMELRLAPHPNVCHLLGWACDAERAQLLLVME